MPKQANLLWHLFHSAVGKCQVFALVWYQSILDCVGAENNSVVSFEGIVTVSINTCALFLAIGRRDRSNDRRRKKCLHTPRTYAPSTAIVGGTYKASVSASVCRNCWGTYRTSVSLSAPSAFLSSLNTLSSIHISAAPSRFNIMIIATK